MVRYSVRAKRTEGNLELNWFIVVSDVGIVIPETILFELWNTADELYLFIALFGSRVLPIKKRE
jgi:hypothetical protein